MLIDKFFIRKITAPLIYPFRTALGQHDELENVLFSLTLRNGAKGFGEAAIATHITGETIPATIKNLENLGPSLIGRDVRDYKTMAMGARAAMPQNKAAAAAVEMALFDAFARSRRMPLWKIFGARPVKLASDITIVIANLTENEGAVKVFYRHGFRSFKVKIGRDRDLDLARVLAVKRLAPRSKIYLDANQGYSAKQSIEFLAALKKAGVRVALIEQPVPKNDWDGLAEVTRAKLACVCADESVVTFEDCKKAIQRKAVNAVNIKLMKSGMIEGERIARLAKKHGMKLMIGAMMETSLAATAAAHFAAGLGCFDFVDLDTPFFIREGLAQNPYLNAKGVYDLKGVREGIGIAGDSE